MEQPLIQPDEDRTEELTSSELWFGMAENEGVDNAREAVLLSIAASLIEIRKALEIQNSILAELLVYLTKGR